MYYEMMHQSVRNLSCKPNIYMSLSVSDIRVWLVPSNVFNPSNNFLTDRSMVVLFLWIIFVICVSCFTVLSILCSIAVTYWERADLLALLYVMFSCVYVTFPYGVLGGHGFPLYGFLIFAFFFT